jgi:hypothetical protein
MTTPFDNFTRAYLAACLWSSNDESTLQGGEPLDANYSIDDFAPEALAQAVSDCARFQNENHVTLAVAGLSDDVAGHNFWLNRCGHGSGFWDELPSSAPESEQLACRALSDASRAFGNLDPYIGDDGKIYFG